MARKPKIEWVWVQDRYRCLFKCITTPIHIICYPYTKEVTQHEKELEEFKTRYSYAQVYVKEDKGPPSLFDEG